MQPTEIEEAGGLLLPLSLVFLFVILWAQLNSSWWSITGGELTGWGSLRAAVPLLVLLVGGGMLLATRVPSRSPRLRMMHPLILLGAFALVGMIAGLALSPSPILSSYWAAAYVAPLLIAGLLVSRAWLLEARDLFHITLAIVAAIATILLVLFSVEADLFHALLEFDLYRVGSNYGNAPVQALTINANGTGRFAALTLLVASSVLLTARGWFGRGLALVAVFAFGSLLVFTQSRGAIFGFVFALFLLVGLYKGWRKAAGMYAIGLLAAGAFFRDEVLGYLSRGFGWTKVRTLTGRTRIWEDLWPHILESPLIGWGFWADRLLVDQEAHNALAGALITSGIVGTAFFLAAWGIVWWFVIRRGLRSRFDWLGEVDRNAAVLATAILGFLTVRAIPESTGTYFGVDLLILVPVMGFLYVLKTDQLPERDGHDDQGRSSSKMPRVLACTYACAPPGSPSFNGGETLLGWRLTEQIARRSNLTALVSAEHRASIEGTQLDGEARFVAVDLPSVLHLLRRFQGGIQLYAYLWQIKAYFVARYLHREEPFDLFHHITYANDWMASHIGAYLDIPYVRGPGGGAQRVPHRMLADRSPRFRLAQRWRSLMQTVLRLDPAYRRGQDEAEALLVCTRDSQRIFPERWREKTEIFPVVGVDPENIPNVSKNTRDTSFTVLCAGKLIELKAFDLAIRAFAKFAHDKENTKLVILGDGPEKPKLERLAEDLGVREKVRFEGWCPHEEVLQRMVDADVFLFPSLRDGGGAVVVEAMAAGTPVLCLDHAGPGIHVDASAGIAIKPTTPPKVTHQFSNALHQFYKREDWRLQIGRSAKKRALECYTWDDHGDRINKIYANILNQPPSPSEERARVPPLAPMGDA